MTPSLRSAQATPQDLSEPVIVTDPFRQGSCPAQGHVRFLFGDGDEAEDKRRPEFRALLSGATTAQSSGLGRAGTPRLRGRDRAPGVFPQPVIRRKFTYPLQTEDQTALPGTPRS